MYVKPFEKSIEMIRLALGCPVFSNFVTSCQFVYEKLEKRPVSLSGCRLERLLVCHSASGSETLGLLCHVILLNVERPLLPQLSLSRNLVEL